MAWLGIGDDFRRTIFLKPPPASLPDLHASGVERVRTVHPMKP